MGRWIVLRFNQLRDTELAGIDFVKKFLRLVRENLVFESVEREKDRIERRKELKASYKLELEK